MSETGKRFESLGLRAGSDKKVLEWSVVYGGHRPVACPPPSTITHVDVILSDIPCSLFQQDNAPGYKAKMVKEPFEESSNEFEVPLNPPDLNQSSKLQARETPTTQ